LHYEKGKVIAGPKHLTLSQGKEDASIQEVGPYSLILLLRGHGHYLEGNASATKVVRILICTSAKPILQKSEVELLKNVISIKAHCPPMLRGQEGEISEN